MFRHSLMFLLPHLPKITVRYINPLLSVLARIHDTTSIMAPYRGPQRHAVSSSHQSASSNVSAMRKIQNQNVLMSKQFVCIADVGFFNNQSSPTIKTTTAWTVWKQRVEQAQEQELMWDRAVFPFRSTISEYNSCFSATLGRQDVKLFATEHQKMQYF